MGCSSERAPIEMLADDRLPGHRRRPHTESRGDGAVISAAEIEDEVARADVHGVAADVCEAQSAARQDVSAHRGRGVRVEGLTKLGDGGGVEHVAVDARLLDGLLGGGGLPTCTCMHVCMRVLMLACWMDSWAAEGLPTCTCMHVCMRVLMLACWMDSWAAEASRPAHVCMCACVC